MKIWNKWKNKIARIFRIRKVTKIEETLQKIIETKPKQLEKENKQINTVSCFKN